MIQLMELLSTDPRPNVSTHCFSLLSKIGKSNETLFYVTFLESSIHPMTLLSPWDGFYIPVMHIASCLTMAKSFSLFVSNPSCCALRIKGGCYRSDLPSYLSYVHMFVIRTYSLSHIHMNYSVSFNHVRQVKTNYYS